MVMNDKHPEEFYKSESYALLLENIEEYAIFMMDTERQVTSWNPGVKRVLGYNQDEFIGQSADMIFTPEDRAADAPTAEMHNASRQGNATDERWHIRKGGSRFWGRGIMVALYTPARDLRGFAKILRDDTARKQAEDALQEREQQLQLLNQQLSELNEQLAERVQERTQAIHALALRLSSAQHEERKRIAQILHDHVQQMLYGIQMRIHLLTLDASVESREQLEGYFDELAQLTGEIIRTTRTLSIEISPPILENESMATIFRWLADHMAKIHGLKVAVTTQEDYSVPNKNLRVVVLQIVQELLFNVVKHAGVDQATITLTRDDNHLVVTVTDEGRGFNVDAVTSKEKARTSLGLSSIDERLSLFQGKLEVYSQQGKGTQVVITIPL
jgi:PAS domain S-box-containing protein